MSYMDAPWLKKTAKLSMGYSKALFNNRPDTGRNLANDITSTGDLFLKGNISKQKKTKCEELSVLKTMQAIIRIACAAVLVKQLR